MAEDIRILGADTHIPRKNLPLVLLGGAAVAAFVFLRPRMRIQTGPTVDQTLAGNAQAADQTGLEFAQLQAQTADQQAQLMASTAIQQQQLNEAYQLSAGMNPGLLQQCIPLVDWYNTAADVRKNLTDQVRNGQLFQTIGPSGICFGPSQAGIAGHPPYVTARSSTGLFGASSSITGPAGSVGSQPPTTGQPGISGLINTLLYILGEAGVITPTTVPRNPYPYPTAPQYPYQYPGYPGFPSPLPPVIV
jgi:hypothetical protein